MSTIGIFCTDIVDNDGDFRELYKAIKKEARAGGWIIRKITGINIIAGKTKGMYSGYSSVALHTIAQDVGKRLKNPILITTIEEGRCKVVELSSKEDNGYRDVSDVIAE